MSDSAEPRSDMRSDEPSRNLCCGWPRGGGGGVEDRDVLMTKAETQAQNPLLVQAGVR